MSKDFLIQKRKYRILHILKEFKRDVPLFLNSVTGTNNNSFEHIICYLGKNHGLKNSLSDLGFEVIYLGFEKKFTTLFNPVIVYKLAQVIKTRDIDVIHCQKHKPTVYGTLAAFFTGTKKVISTVHGLVRTRSLGRRIANLIIFKYVNKIIAVSDAVREDIIKSNWFLNASKVVTIRNGIDLSSINGIRIDKKTAKLKMAISPEDFVFGAVGRLVKTKGHSYLLEAFSHCIQKMPKARLVIIGEGPLSVSLKKKAKALGLSSYVLWLGHRNDVLELIRGFDIFVLPSILEGLSIALLEAMSSKLPVVASNVGGIPEVFGKTQCGRLVTAKDVYALASAMLEMYFLDEDTKKLLGENGENRVKEEFNADLMCKNLIGVYESLSDKFTN